MSAQLALPLDRLDLALQAVETCPHLYRQDFSAWLRDNWAIYRAFEREALIVRERGRSHYGANTIIEYLRHQTVLADAAAEWKIDDRWTSSIARLFAALNPSCVDFFQFRERMGGVVKAPVLKAGAA